MNISTYIFFNVVGLTDQLIAFVWEDSGMLFWPVWSARIETASGKFDGVNIRQQANGFCLLTYVFAFF